jgi:hypothetical protein
MQFLYFHISFWSAVLKICRDSIFKLVVSFKIGVSQEEITTWINVKASTCSSEILVLWKSYILCTNLIVFAMIRSLFSMIYVMSSVSETPNVQGLSYCSWIYKYLCIVPITTKVVSLNPAQAKCIWYNIMW